MAAVPAVIDPVAPHLGAPADRSGEIALHAQAELVVGVAPAGIGIRYGDTFGCSVRPLGSGMLQTQPAKLQPIVLQCFARYAFVLVEFELGLVILLQPWILVFLAHITIADSKNIKFVTHEASERIFRRTYNWFAAHVEAGIYYHRAPCFPLEC